MIKMLRKILLPVLIVVFFFQSYPKSVLAYDNVYSGVEKHQGIYFSDVTENGEHNWANEAIYKMSAFGIVQGVEKGLYKPAQNVTRAQSLAFILRSMASEKQAVILAEEIDKLRKDKKSFVKSAVDWSDGYIALAFDMGLITNEQYRDAFGNSPIVFNRNGAATRQEVAYWIAKAFSISPSYDNTITNIYKDSNLIDSDIRPYLNALVKKRLMVGSDNRLNPLGSITRAEIVQILLNCEGYITNKLGITAQSGVITKTPTKNIIEIGSNAIVLDSAKGEGIDVFYNGKIGSVNLISLNDNITYYINRDNKVIFAEVTPGEKTTTGENYITSGIVHSVSGKKITLYDESGKTDSSLLRDFAISSNAVILRNNQSVSISKIEPNQRVFLKVVDGYVTEISFSSTVSDDSAPITESYIDNIYKAELDSYNSLTQTVFVKDVLVFDTSTWDYINQKGIVELKVNPSTKLYYGNTVISVDELNDYIGEELIFAVGSGVDAENKALFLRISEKSDPSLYTDKITSINTSTRSLELSKTRVSISAGDGTIIVKDGQLVPLSKVSKSDLVSIATKKTGSGYNAYFMVVDNSLEAEDMHIYYSRIESMTNGNKVVLTTSKEYDTEELKITSNKRKLNLKISNDTRFYDPDGLINNRDINIWSNEDSGEYANVVTKDGEAIAVSFGNGAYSVLTAKVGSVIKEGSKVTGLYIYRAWSYYNGTFNETLDNCGLNFGNNTIILKNDKLINASEVKVGDTITAFYSKDSSFSEDYDEEMKYRAIVIIID